MAINPAISSANVANKAAQIGYAQNVTAPKELKQTEEPRRIQVLDEEGLEEQSSLRDTAQQGNMEDATGVSRQRVDSVRRDGQERRQVQTGGSTGSTSEAGRTSESTPETTSQFQPQQGPGTSDVATRTLRLALSDNSRQLQAQYDSQTQQTGQQGPQLGTEARRTVMLRNLESMVNLQLAQYTGNEPYTRSNYRQILGALGQMQGGGNQQAKTAPGGTVDSRNDEGWGSAEGAEGQRDGVYTLYSGQAARTLSYLNPEPDRRNGGEPLDLVA